MRSWDERHAAYAAARQTALNTSIQTLEDAVNYLDPSIRTELLRNAVEQLATAVEDAWLELERHTDYQ
jgi:hypothetical protein